MKHEVIDLDSRRKRKEGELSVGGVFAIFLSILCVSQCAYHESSTYALEWRIKHQAEFIIDKATYQCRMTNQLTETAGR